MITMIAHLIAGTLLAISQPETIHATPILQPQTEAQDAEGQNQDAEDQTQPTIDNVDALLLALENSGKQLESFQAKIIYHKEFPFEGDEQTRIGDLYFVVDNQSPTPRRKFAVHFNQLEFAGRVETGEDRSYIFDGEYLVEKHFKERQCFKRRVVPPGQTFDPLRLGEGPFPIPIGQRREEILERFNAELLPLKDGTNDFAPDVINWLKNEHHPTYQLRLTPREEFADELDLAEIRIWYRKSDLLPRAAWTRAVNANLSTIRLINQRANEPIDAALVDTRLPNVGWDVEVTEWRGSVGDTP